jgi:hypothetical protein
MTSCTSAPNRITPRLAIRLPARGTALSMSISVNEAYEELNQAVDCAAHKLSVFINFKCIETFSDYRSKPQYSSREVLRQVCDIQRAAIMVEEFKQTLDEWADKV